MTSREKKLHILLYLQMQQSSSNQHWQWGTIENQSDVKGEERREGCSRMIAVIRPWQILSLTSILICNLGPPIWPWECFSGPCQLFHGEFWGEGGAMCPGSASLVSSLGQAGLWVKVRGHLIEKPFPSHPRRACCWFLCCSWAAVPGSHF